MRDEVEVPDELINSNEPLLWRPKASSWYMRPSVDTVPFPSIQPLKNQCEQALKSKKHLL